MPRSKAKPDARKPGRKPLQTIVLRTRHTINGFPYGPGTVTVREDIATVLMEQETRSKAEFESWFVPRAGLITPTAGGVHQRSVNPEYFDQAFTAEQPRIYTR